MVYGLSSSGMTIQFHYCCGKLKNIRLSPVAERQCGMKHSLSKKPCCNDRQVEFKLKADQKSEQAAKFIFSVPALSKAEVDGTTALPELAKAITPELFAPPPLPTQLYILHCVYRI